MMVLTTSEQNPEGDAVPSQDAAVPHSPADVSGRIDSDSVPRGMPAARSRDHEVPVPDSRHRVSEPLTRAAAGFRGTFRQNILKTTTYLQELDNDLRHYYPGQSEVREDLIALASVICNVRQDPIGASM